MHFGLNVLRRNTKSPLAAADEPQTEMRLYSPTSLRPQKSVAFVARSVARFFAAQSLMPQRRFRYLSQESVAYGNTAVMFLRRLIRWVVRCQLQPTAA